MLHWMCQQCGHEAIWADGMRAHRWQVCEPLRTGLLDDLAAIASERLSLELLVQLLMPMLLTCMVRNLVRVCIARVMVLFEHEPQE